MKIIELNKFILEQHIDEFINIDSDFPGGTWKMENFKLELLGKWEYSLALQINEKIGGYIIASSKDTHIHIHRFSIHKDYRNRKFGLTLLREFEKKCKAANRIFIGLNVSNENIRALEFYSRNGFSINKLEGHDKYLVKKLDKIVAIHQPNLFPWLGFFDKINKADVFIVLDHVLNRPNDAIYTKRVTILNNKVPYWLTIPLLKPKGIEFLKIKDMKINQSDDFSKKQLKTIEQNYKKTPYFNDIFPIINKFYVSNSEFISQRNIEFIRDVCEKLKIKTQFIYSSELYPILSATEMLVELTLKVNGEIYLAGGGASEYQQDSLFKDSSIKIAFQDFKHPVYDQINADTFVSGLSVLDCLMNNGFEKTKEILTFMDN